MAGLVAPNALRMPICRVRRLTLKLARPMMQCRDDGQQQDDEAQGKRGGRPQEAARWGRQKQHADGQVEPVEVEDVGGPERSVGETQDEQGQGPLEQHPTDPDRFLSLARLP